jgi:hypothetical protein
MAKSSQKLENVPFLRNLAEARRRYRGPTAPGTVVIDSDPRELNKPNRRERPAPVES